MPPENEQAGVGIDDALEHLPFGIGRGPYADDVDRVTEQSDNMSANRASLESRLDGGTDPNYASTSEVFDGYSHSQLYDFVQTLQPVEMSAAGQLWIEAATGIHQSCGGLLTSALPEVDHNWDGPTAREVRSMIGQVNESGLDSGTVMQSVGLRMTQATSIAEALKSTVPPPMPPVPLPMDIAAGPVVAYAEAQRRAEEQRRQAIDLLNSIYTPQLRPTGDAVPAFGSSAPGPTGDSGGAAGSFGSSGSAAASGTGASGWGSGSGGLPNGNGAAAPAGTAAAGSGDGGNPAGAPGSNTPGSNSGSSPGSGANSAQSGGSTQPSGASGAAPVGGGAGTTRPATAAGPSGLAGIGAPNSGAAGIGRPGSGTGGGRGASSGGGAGGIGSGGGRPGVGGGAGGVSGTGGSAIGSGPTGSGGAARSGYVPMGMMPASRGGSGDDQELRGASYLVDPENGNELIGDLPATVTPVLGEWKET